MSADRPLEGSNKGKQTTALTEQYVKETAPANADQKVAAASTDNKPEAATDKTTSDAKPIVAFERGVERKSVSPNDQSEKILAVLNGTDGKGRVNIPPSTKQLVVVTSDDFKSDVAMLRFMERGSGKNADWQETMSWPVNLGANPLTMPSGEKVRSSGMAYALGGLIENKAGGEPTTGPEIKKGKLVDKTKDPNSHIKIEGDGRNPAGLFELGFAWGFNNNLERTGMPYKDLKPGYRLVPQDGEELRSANGEKLNGQILRQVDPKTGAYEVLNPNTGESTTGKMSKETLDKVLKLNEYRWVHKDINDGSDEKTPLRNQLVRINKEDLQYDANNLPIFRKNAGYESVDPRTGERHTGKLSENAMKEIVRESDFRWADDFYGTENGKRVHLYNKPVRILNDNGDYERFDRDTGRVVAKGRVEPDQFKDFMNESAEMSHELYRHALVLRQNKQGIPGGGASIFLHEERKNIEFGQPSTTSGCTAMSAIRMEQLLANMRYDKRPLILQAPIGELDTIRDALRHQRWGKKQ